jgi:hypothetical protein
MAAAAGTVGTSWMSSAVGPLETDSRKVSNSSRTQLEHLSNNCGDNRNITDVNNRWKTRKSKEAISSRDKPTTVLLLASEGTPTAQYGRQQHMSFRGNS